MGLGKTFQVTCLLASLIRRGLVQRILIVAPVSVLQTWNRHIVEDLTPYVKVGGRR
jgi:SNF2 family DNA or RNA helicase